MDVQQFKRLRMVGTHAFTANGNDVNNGVTEADWTIPQLQYMNDSQQMVDVPSEMDGAHYEIKNSNLGDRLKYQVIHPQYGVVDEFGDILVMDGVHLLSFYVAALPAGLKIRCRYEAAGPNQASVIINLFRHIDTRKVNDTE